MTKQQVLGLAIKLAAIYLLFHIVREGSAFIFSASQFMEGESNWLFYSSIITFIFIVVTLLIYKFPLSVAGKLLKKGANEGLKWKVSFKDLEVGAYIILGIYVLVTAIPDIFYWGVVSFQYANSKTPIQGLSIEQIASIYTTVIELIIGFVLVFGATTIRETLYRIRYLGVNK